MSEYKFTISDPNFDPEDYKQDVGNYIAKLAKELAMNYDKAFYEGLKNLSPRKKKKIKKWVLKEIRRMNKCRKEEN